jgi:CRISPR/Cas system-associated exonuclease Cas4 (RecB family)
MKIPHISVSRADNYEGCPQRYKYRYELEVMPKEEAFHFTYGKIVHKIAELYVKNKGEMLISEAASEVLEGKVEIEENKFAPKLTNEYMTRLSNNLRWIKYLTDKIGFNGYVEYPFEYDLEPPLGKILKGFIDRIDSDNGEYRIIDYKTTKPGRFRKNSINITSDIQLRTYAKVVQRNFGAKAENIRVALYFLEDGQLVSVRFSQKSLDEAERYLVKVYDKIKAHDPNLVVGTPGEWCRNCDYFDICPFKR